MKNILLALILSLVTITLYAQEEQQPTQEQSITEAERIVDKYLEQAGNGIAALAEKLEAPAEYVYQVLVTQYIVRGIVDLFLTILFVFILILSLNRILNTFKLQDELNEEVLGTNLVTFIILGVLSLIASCGYLITISETITMIFNPDYHILMDIKDFIKAN